ncbi:MAG: hypothetical protein HC869_22210, partial [Rhodospirillales bacterium]|nr:hypothetical protein [Rhodospirillales bacterium]
MADEGPGEQRGGEQEGECGEVSGKVGLGAEVEQEIGSAHVLDREVEEVADEVDGGVGGGKEQDKA